MPAGALFVSKRTTESKQPFIKWASDFLGQIGAPIFPLDPKANKHLFSEVSEEELEDRCVVELLRSKEELAKVSCECPFVSSASHKYLPCFA